MAAPQPTYCAIRKQLSKKLEIILQELADKRGVLQTDMSIYDRHDVAQKLLREHIEQHGCKR